MFGGFELVWCLLLLFIGNTAGLTARWVNVESIKPFSLFSVHANSANDVFAAAVDNEKGSFVYYSYNGGESWETLPTKGNNYAMAVSHSGKTLCAAGTKAYCANATQSLEWEIFELTFQASAHDVKTVGQEGFAMVGGFGLNGELLNGVAYLKNFDYAWSLYDIGLDRNEGYYALQGSFPSATTWYIVSGSWPVQTEIIANVLSGRLGMVPNGKYFFSYKYEYLKLFPSDEKNRYIGAISKTTDGGKTWSKVFDSNNEFFINQMDCIDGGEICLAVGEGPEKTVVLKTVDGGASWKTALSLNSSYSLHACEMITSTTYWVGGGIIVQDNIQGIQGNENFIGIYFKTDNAGENWEMFTGSGYVYDFSFVNEKNGYAATIFHDHCGMSKLTYK